MSSIRVFKTFLAVAEHGSFARAGEVVGLTPAAVGLQMRALEQDLDQGLFDRRGRSIVLNTAGRSAVRAISDLVNRYEAIAATSEGGLAGTVVVGALVSSLVGAFGRALWSLKNAHPRLDVKLIAGLSADFAARVDHGELDVAVIAKPPGVIPRSLKWTNLYSEPMVLIVPRRPHFRLSGSAVEVLERAPFMRFDRHTWTGQLVDQALRKAGASPRDALELNSVDAIASLVREGYGVSVVPQIDKRWTADRDLRILPLPGNHVRRHVGLLERSVHSRTRFTDAIKQQFRS